MDQTTRRFLFKVLSDPKTPASIKKRIATKHQANPEFPKLIKDIGADKESWYVMMQRKAQKQNKINKAKERAAMSTKAYGAGTSGKTVNSDELSEAAGDKQLMKARVLYAQTYMKHAKTVGKSKQAQEMAYAAVEKKHGPDVVAMLKKYHASNQKMDEAADKLFGARKLYAKTYMKNAKTAMASKQAKQTAYDTVEKQYGPDMLAALKKHHNSAMDEGYVKASNKKKKNVFVRMLAKDDSSAYASSWKAQKAAAQKAGRAKLKGAEQVQEVSTDLLTRASVAAGKKRDAAIEVSYPNKPDWKEHDKRNKQVRKFLDAIRKKTPKRPEYIPPNEDPYGYGRMNAYHMDEETKIGTVSAEHMKGPSADKPHGVIVKVFKEFKNRGDSGWVTHHVKAFKKKEQAQAYIERVQKNGPMKESVQIDELDKETLRSYVSKAKNERLYQDVPFSKKYPRGSRKYKNRETGEQRALAKIHTKPIVTAEASVQQLLAYQKIRQRMLSLKNAELIARTQMMNIAEPLTEKKSDKYIDMVLEKARSKVKKTQIVNLDPKLETKHSPGASQITDHAAEGSEGANVKVET